jgi:hypothetical protein
LALFGLATVLATFQNIGRFFPNHPVTLVGVSFNPPVFKSGHGDAEEPDDEDVEALDYDVGGNNYKYLVPEAQFLHLGPMFYNFLRPLVTIFVLS